MSSSIVHRAHKAAEDAVDGHVLGEHGPSWPREDAAYLHKTQARRKEVLPLVMDNSDCLQQQGQGLHITLPVTAWHMQQQCQSGQAFTFPVESTSASQFQAETEEKGARPVMERV